MIDYLIKLWDDMYFEINPYTGASRKMVIKFCSAIMIYFISKPPNGKEFRANIKNMFQKYQIDTLDFEHVFDIILKCYREFYKKTLNFNITKDYIILLKLDIETFLNQENYSDEYEKLYIKLRQNEYKNHGYIYFDDEKMELTPSEKINFYSNLCGCKLDKMAKQKEIKDVKSQN